MEILPDEQAVRTAGGTALFTVPDTAVKCGAAPQKIMYLADAKGWCAADKFMLRHPRYPQVFALGDAAGLPTSKTGAAIRKQAPVLVANLRAALQQQALPAAYNGYSSCPVVTGYGKMVLAEFDYDGQPAESFPFDQSKERYSMWLLKTQVLPRLYWKACFAGGSDGGYPSARSCPWHCRQRPITLDPQA